MAWPVPTSLPGACPAEKRSDFFRVSLSHHWNQYHLFISSNRLTNYLPCQSFISLAIFGLSEFVLQFTQRVSSLSTPYNGSKLRPIQSPAFFRLRLKYPVKSQICYLFSTSLFWSKRVSSCHFAATFAKINKWQNCCFSPWMFLQYEDSIIVA